MVFFMVPGLGECSYLTPRLIKSHVLQLSSTLACLGVRMPVGPFKHREKGLPLPGVHLSVPHLGGVCKQCSRHFSMVLLGLQSRFLTFSYKWLHRESQKHRTDEGFRGAFSRISLDTFHPLQLLPDGIWLRDGGNSNGWHR